MIYQTDLNNPSAKVITITALIYLKGRELPIVKDVGFCFDITYLTRDNPVESFMAILDASLRGHWGDGNTYFLSDEFYNTLMVVRDEIQAISIEAPADAIWKALE